VTEHAEHGPDDDRSRQHTPSVSVVALAVVLAESTIVHQQVQPDGDAEQDERGRGVRAALDRQVAQEGVGAREEPEVEL
jgi:hypothetical protein